MEIFSILNLIVTLGAMAGYAVLRFRHTGVTPTAIAQSSPAHQMVRVWINHSATYTQRGWWYECSCGRKQPGQGISSRYMGSEGEAIRSYKAHAALYLTLTAPVDNPFEKKYTDEVAAYQEYVSKCFCKDTNDDLLVLKNRHLDKHL